jgi:hypothetical protein
MSDNEERRVKARHDVTQFYQRRKVVSIREMPRGDMPISDDPNPDDTSNISDNDIENDTYVLSPRAHPHRKGLASASDSGVARDNEIEEDTDGTDGEEEEEFDVEEINPPSYVDIGPLGFRAPSNPTWRVKVGYKGKTEAVREKRMINARTLSRDAYDYRFHSIFQQDLYESVITPKSKTVANSQ